MVTLNEALAALKTKIRCNELEVAGLYERIQGLNQDTENMYVKAFAYLGWVPGAVIQNKKERGIYLGPRGSASFHYENKDTPYAFYFRPFKKDGTPANKRLVGYGSEDWVLTGEKAELPHAGL